MPRRKKTLPPTGPLLRRMRKPPNAWSRARPKRSAMRRSPPSASPSPSASTAECATDIESSGKMAGMKVLLFAIAVVFSAGTFAQTKFGQPPQAAPAGAPPADFKPLPERKDVVSWRVLAQVELVKLKDRYQPQFSSAVAALD